MIRLGRLGLAYNPKMAAALDLAGRATRWCDERGIASWMAPAGELDTLVRELATTDALVVLGGDGTILLAARAAARVDVPLVGVNLGKVGFLSKAEAHELEPTLERIERGAFRIEERMALEGAIHPAGAVEPGRVFTALNDIVVARGSLARVIHLSVDIGPSHLATYVADGLVVASPTGSTGYSFSAGGPILEPDTRALILTPIAAYLSALRAIVIDPSQTVRCRVIEAHEVLVSVDGRTDIPIAVGDVVTVAARARPIRFLEPEGALPFWDLLRQKAELLPS